MQKYTDYYTVDSNGYYLSTLSLLPEELKNYTGLLTEKPPTRPTRVRDVEAENLASAKEYAIRYINTKRRTEAQSTIFYNNIEVEADSISQSIMSLKLVEVRKTISQGLTIPPEELVWRDAANHTHSFNSLTEYEAWISGVLTAISKRNSEIYSDSWTKKSLIEASTSPEEIFIIAGIV
ncbi:MAG: hypothetical protein ACO3UU_03015 [Minisyncoccia bacterium]